MDEAIWKEFETRCSSVKTVQAAPMGSIQDSGDRTEFESGAVRDMHEGKGRCDLLPLDVAVDLLSEEDCSILIPIAQYENHAMTSSGSELLEALEKFICAHEEWNGDPYTALLEIAIHFEEGAKKYGDNNWRKGIPVNVYLDSAIRHYLKYRRGDYDEPHDRAFCWNLMCAVWTIRHILLAPKEG